MQSLNKELRWRRLGAREIRSYGISLRLLTGFLVPKLDMHLIGRLVLRDQIGSG